MFNNSRLTSQDPRRGVILMVVLALLALMAVVGLSFVLYADAESRASDITRDAETQPVTYEQGPDMPPDVLANYFLSQLIYGVSDPKAATDAADSYDPTRVNSALRGYDLARSMYGYNDTTNAVNQTPWNGIGRLRNGFFGLASPTGITADDYNLLNYMYFVDNQGNLVDKFVRDPERPGYRNNSLALAARQSYLGGFNVSYTYPDVNNLFLAAVKADGTVLARSFYRDTGFGSLAPTNPNWLSSTAQLKYQTLRPRPIDQLISSLGETNVVQNTSGFPAAGLPADNLWYVVNASGSPVRLAFPPPDDAGGDVRNLSATPYAGFQQPTPYNDSIWLDLGYPIMKTRDGRQVKPLFAALIMDLDNRVNLNVAGNVRARDNNGNPQHGSNQGWGPWEINLSQVLNATASPTEWSQLFYGKNSPEVTGKYGMGTSSQPGAGSSVVPPTTAPPSFAAADLDAVQTNAAPQAGNPQTYSLSTGLRVPSEDTGNQAYNNPYFPFAHITTPNGAPESSYGNGSVYERTNNPSLFNVFQPAYNYGYGSGVSVNNRDFHPANMEALLRWGEVGSGQLWSDVLRLLPNNLADNSTGSPAGQAAARRRAMLTTTSAALDRPGITPWLWNQNKASTYTIAANVSNSAYAGGSSQGTPSSNNNAQTTPTEFATDVRSLTAAMGKVNLNRNLPAYPTVTNGQFVGDPSGSIFQAAQAARQQLAKDIYQRLRLATTGSINDPQLQANATPPQISQYAAMRWLAQLAVNMVDFIDSDDIMTPFLWNPTNAPDEYLYGQELPRLVINEVYSEIQNDPSDSNVNQQGSKAPMLPYRCQFWVELTNPFPSNDPNLTDSGNARLQVNANQIPYQLAIAQYSAGAFSAANLSGPLHNLQQDPFAAGTQYAATPWRFPSYSLGNFYNLNNAAPANNPSAPVVILLNNWTAGTQATGQPASGINFVQPSTGQPGAAGAYQGTAGTNKNGFYVVGPASPDGLNTGATGQDSPLSTPTVTMTYNMATPPGGSLTNNSMTYQFPLETSPASTTPPTHTVYLRRLACPYLPFNASTNPYVTVDYWNNVPINDARWVLNTPQVGSNPKVYKNIGQGGAANAQGYLQLANRNSVGRGQPYYGRSSYAQTFNAPANQPKNSMFMQNWSQNAALPTAGGPPFDWLVHFDRALVSPLELLHVSMYRPFELTNAFNQTTGVGQNSNHLQSVWRAVLDPNSRLYRAFEFFETEPRLTGDAPSGRVPGKININTVWDVEVFQALCDAQAANGFAATDVQNIWKALLAQRSPTLTANNSLSPTSDRPLRGLAAPYIPSGDTQYPVIGTSPYGSSNQDTFLSASSYPISNPATSTFLLEVPGKTHPYRRFELMEKIFGNVTTRSNVFAVWVTVGFFEVPPGGEAFNPPKLGAEYLRSQNKHVRHRLFAVVDRSMLGRPFVDQQGQSLVSSSGIQAPVFLKGKSSVTVPAGQSSVSATIQVDTTSGNYEDIPWSINVGDWLLVDVGYPNTQLPPTPPLKASQNTLPAAPPGNQEWVKVTAVTSQSFTATFQLSSQVTQPTTASQLIHPAGFLINLYAQPGNPGPQSRYDARQDPGVVKYLSIIQ